MKFNKSRQLMLVSAASLLVAGLLSACGTTLTTDFVFVASSKAAGPNNYGEMDVFEINYESGFMRQIPTSPFPSGGRNPVAEALSTDNTNLFVVNRDDNSVVQFIIGNDGKLYPQNTVNTPGIFPLAIATTSSYAFVADLYKPLPTCSSASPCSGSVGVFPIGSTKDNPPSHPLGTPIANGTINYWPLAITGAQANDIITPTGIAVYTSGSNSYLYVTAYDATTTAPVGYVFGFQIGSNGALAAVPGSPFQVGGAPSAVAGNTGTSSLYVTDSARNYVYGFTVGTNGALTSLSGSPYPAGSQPGAVVVNRAYPYLYVANAQDSTMSYYSIGTGGVLTRLGSVATGIQPVAIGIDPSTNGFIFTANYIGNDLSNYQLNPQNGALVQTQNNPYSSHAQPTAVAAIPHKHD